MVRGSVIWVALDPTRGAEVPKTRPCIVVSRAVANEFSATATVVPLSSVKGKAPARLVQPLLAAGETGLPKDSRALCDQVRTVDKLRLGRIVRVLDAEAMLRIDRGLILHLELERHFKDLLLN